MTFNGTTLTVNDLTDSSLTATRIVFAGTAGNLNDSANLTWNGTTLSSTQVNITGQGTLRLEDTTGGEYVGLRSPSALGASYTLTFPADDGTSGQALITDGSGGLSWSTAASGDVYGPASSTDNAVARFDSTTGKIIQNSVVIVGDTGDVTGVGTLSAATLNLTNALGTAYGGTGLTSFTSGGVVYASGTGTLATGSALTYTGNILVNQPTVGTGFSLLQCVNTGGTAFIGLDNSGGGILSPYALNIYHSGAYPIIFSTSGTEGLRLTSSSLYTASGINVGIGLSNPAYKLSVSAADTGNVVGGSTAAVTISNSNSAAFGRTVDLNFGVGAELKIAGLSAVYTNFSSSVGGALAFCTNNGSSSYAERMRLDSAGNLGLAVPPSAWNSGYKFLQFSDATGAFYGGSGYSLQLGSNAYINSSSVWVYGGGAYKAARYEQFDGTHKWFSSTASPVTGNDVVFSQAMTLDASGNLGVGTTSPATKVHAAIASATTYTTSSRGNVLTIQNTTAGGYAGIEFLTDPSSGNAGIGGINAFNTGSGDSVLAFSTRGSATLAERARIDSSGNFLLGRSVSIAKFNVGSAGGTSYPTYSSPSAGGFDGGFLAATTNSADTYLTLLDIGSVTAGTDGTNGGSAIRFLTQPKVAPYALIERARITLDGALLIGKTSGGGTTKGIQLEQNGTAIFTTDSNAVDPLSYFVNSNASPTNGFRYVSFRAGSGFAEVGTITTNGSSTTAYNTSSDYRLKNTITPMTGALAKVALLKPCTYKWNADGSDGEGFIAHELAEVCPSAVTGAKDAVDADGNPKYQGIDVSFLVATLTAALQEQQAIIESLKARLDAANL
jgi:hypothetical protein